MLVVITVWLHGCSKGVEMEGESLVFVSLKSKTIDPVNCQFLLNGEVQDPYVTNGSPIGKTLTLSADAKSIQVKIVDLPAKNVLADVNYSPRLGKNDSLYFSLFQLASGTTPYLVLPADTAALPEVGYGKLQFIYGTASMPDSIHLKFYYSNNTSPVDSCIVRRNVYSNWVNISLITKGVLQYEVYNAVTNVLVASKRTYPIARVHTSMGLNIHTIEKDANNNYLFTQLY
ncbi:hypothetical protein FLA_1670 [Filimonas lacunae]|nr:hypothetical protein FLA_1670 [Filimonas lacunae]